MYTIKTITRVCEGASPEDMINGDGYETAYLVYDEDGDIIMDTTNEKEAMKYLDTDEPKEHMSYYIGSINGSGIETDNFEDFVEYLRDMVETAKKQGDTEFDITVENYLTGDDFDEDFEEDFSEDILEREAELPWDYGKHFE